MGNLIVENRTGIYTITDISVSSNGQTVTTRPNLNIPDGQVSEAIPLPLGGYTVRVTLKYKAEKAYTVDKSVFIEKDGTTQLQIDTLDLNPEPQTPVPPNLV